MERGWAAAPELRPTLRVVPLPAGTSGQRPAQLLSLSRPCNDRPTLHQLSPSLHPPLLCSQWGPAECTDPSSDPPTATESPRAAWSSLRILSQKGRGRGARAPWHPAWPSSLFPDPTAGPAGSTLILFPGGSKGAPLPGMGLFLRSPCSSHPLHLRSPTPTIPWHPLPSCALTPKLFPP